MDSTLVPHYLPGCKNTLADSLSRVSLDDNIKVNPLVISEIEHGFGKITIDRFVTNKNKICATYNSYFLEQTAWGVDAFA